MSSIPCFTFDRGNFFTPAPGNIIVGENLEFLLGILCSKTYYYALRKFYMGGGIEGELKTNRLLKLPIILYNDIVEINSITKLVKKILSCDENKNLLDEVENIIMNKLRITEIEKEYILSFNKKTKN